MFLCDNNNIGKQNSLSTDRLCRYFCIMNDHSKAVNLIEQFEGFSSVAYKCPAGIWTIGYGSTSIDGVPVVERQVITRQKARDDLYSRVEELTKQIDKLVDVDLNNNQLNALIDFCYNLGIGNFRSSTLLKKLNQQDYQGAADELLKWNKSSGKVLAGLTRRREAERDLFLS